MISTIDAYICMNFNLHLPEIDSACEANNIKHYYYLYGMEAKEIDSFAKKILGIHIINKKLLSSQKAVDLGLPENFDFDRVHFIVSNNHVIKTYAIYGLTVDAISPAIFINQLHPFTPLEKTQRVVSDSFYLKYSYKVEIDSHIRLNKMCKFEMYDRVTYILEPMFHSKLYKVSNQSGKIIAEYNFSDLNNLYDSLLRQIYPNIQEFPECFQIGFADALIEYKEELLEHRLGDLEMYNDTLYVHLDKKIPVLVDSIHFLPLNYRCLVKLNKELEFIDFYIDKYISYYKQYPLAGYMFNFNPYDHTLPNIRDYNEKLTELVAYRFKIVEPHSITPYKKDTFHIPLTLSKPIYSNQGGFYGLIDSFWILRDLPFLYSPHTNLYYNLISKSSSKHIPDSLPDYCYIHDIKLLENRMYLVFETPFGCYFSVFNTLKHQVESATYLGPLPKYKLMASLSNEGILFYTTSTHTPDSHFLYIQSD